MFLKSRWLFVLSCILFCIQCQDKTQQIQSRQFYEEGKELERAGHVREALEKYKQAIRIDFKNTEAHNRIGQLYPSLQLSNSIPLDTLNKR